MDTVIPVDEGAENKLSDRLYRAFFAIVTFVGRRINARRPETGPSSNIDTRDLSGYKGLLIDLHVRECGTHRRLHLTALFGNMFLKLLGVVYAHRPEAMRVHTSLLRNCRT